MTIENKVELTGSDQEPEIIGLEPYVTKALRMISLPQQEQGGCTIMPRKFSVSADEPGFCWNMDTVNGIVESSQEHVWNAPGDLADLFGRILLNLRAGRSTTVGVKRYPIIKNLDR